MDRVYNFAPGPSMLPLPVLKKVQEELLCYGSTGMSVMEMSHRSRMYLDIFEQTVADLREVMGVPQGYKIMFVQGGATAMFSAVAPMLYRPYISWGWERNCPSVRASTSSVLPVPRPQRAPRR